MSVPPLIRDETHEDVAHIATLTAAAFGPMSFSDGTEPAMIEGLRAAQDLTLSLVAEQDGDIVGHVAFSPTTIEGRHDGWFALGPISVRPDLQRRGIGKALITEGLARLTKLGAAGCALIGDPGYYSAFGFRSDGLLIHPGLEPRFVQWLLLRPGPSPVGVLRFAAAFGPDPTAS